MDIKVGGSNRTRPQDGNDGGFSDVLGSVGKEGKDGGRRQQGLSDTGGGVQRGRDFGKEFRFTQKASERPIGRDPGGARQPGTQNGSFGGMEQPDAQMADEILSEAAGLVTQMLRDSGEKPSKAEAAEMLAQALKTLKSDGDSEEVPEDAMIDALMQVFADISQDVTAAGTGITVEAETDDLTVGDEAAGLAETVADAVPMTAEMMPAADEAAAASEVTDSDAAEFAAQLAEAEMAEIGTDPGLKAFVGDSVQKLAEGRLTFEAAVDEFTAVEAEPAEPEIPELADNATVQDTLKMMADLLEEAKDKLGLSEVRIEHVYDNETDEVPMLHGDNSQLSHKMFGRDSTGELDHILSGTRFDVSEDDDKPETETYDAVRMASELMQSRTDTDIPVENEPMFPEAMHVSPPEVQAAEQILDRIQQMQSDHTEFTMVLNPEALGKITVKLAVAGEKVSVEITADDPRTGAMLAARSEGLQNMLRDGGVQLEKCQIVSEHEDTQFNEQSYEGSSKNPYSRNDDEEGSDHDDGDGESFYDLLQSI